MPDLCNRSERRFALRSRTEPDELRLARGLTAISNRPRQRAPRSAARDQQSRKTSQSTAHHASKRRSSPRRRRGRRPAKRKSQSNPMRTEMTESQLSAVQEQHQKAMEFCDRALEARCRGNQRDAKSLLSKAFEHERKAAAAVEKATNLEPTRAVLHRSAAALAIECGEYRAAEKLIATALLGNPPPEIADELRDLFDKANFERRSNIHRSPLRPTVGSLPARVLTTTDALQARAWTNTGNTSSPEVTVISPENRSLFHVADA